MSLPGRFHSKRTRQPQPVEPEAQGAARADVTEEFEGIHVAHWEVARFVVQAGRGLLGRPRIEKWQALFPAGFELPDADTHDRYSPARTYRMRVRGRLGALADYRLRIHRSKSARCTMPSTRIT